MNHAPSTGAPATSDPDAADGLPATDQQFVTFSIADQMFAVPMAPVQEIIRVPDVARLPLAPAALDGLANLRGRVLPIVNLRRVLHTGDRAHDDATRALVINLGQPLGFVVDRVASVVNVDRAEIEQASQVQSIVQAEYLSGVINRSGADGRRQLMPILDFQRLVEDQFSALQRATTGSLGGGERGFREDAADKAAEGADELRLVSFTVAGQEYGIDIAEVREIVQVPEHITGVPNTAHHVLGLISLRERLLPLVSLRSLFGLPTLDADESHRIVVVAVPGGGQVGLLTDAVKEVLTLQHTEAEPVPAVLAGNARLQEFERICRLDDGKRLVAVISVERLLGLDAMREALDAAAQSPSLSTDEEPGMTRDTPIDDDTQVVIFRLGAEEFGVPIMSVQEIVRVPEVLTRVPHTPPFVEGVINLRGIVLPVIDQRARLGLGSIERNEGQRIMVFNFGGMRTGFIVDSVAEVLRICRQHIEQAPDLSAQQRRVIHRVAKLDGGARLVMLIDPTQLLLANEAQAVTAMAQPDAAAEPRPLPLAA